ncbi:MAG TPA: glycosyltransferase family 2 protein [Candidatus Saccharimonadales bacterium]|nr:glycosyltransferase family 2 protein [Candidatus Saccharimonadales bacterium]
MGTPQETAYPLIGLIASKNPVSALELTVQSLFRGGCSRVVVVNDGSDDPQSLLIFDRVASAGAEIIHLEKNVGKCAALKVGFKTIPRQSLIVQTDDDTLAGDLAGPARMLREHKADIVDIRVETARTHSLLGFVQELDYWLINAVTKRVQDFLKARLWMSGASVMYNYKAGVELLTRKTYTITEDTEGMFRARTKGCTIKFYSKRDAQFITMVPEDFHGLHKQWKRWTTGNGQVIGRYGFGGGSTWIATINIFTWLQIFVPIVVAVRFGIVSTSLWAFGWGFLAGVVGAIQLKRPRVALVGIFMPFFTLAWNLYAIVGLYLAYRYSRSGKEVVLTWISPKRTTIEALP